MRPPETESARKRRLLDEERQRERVRCARETRCWHCYHAPCTCPDGDGLRERRST